MRRKRNVLPLWGKEKIPPHPPLQKGGYRGDLASSPASPVGRQNPPLPPFDKGANLKKAARLSLETRIGSLIFKNPVSVASGTFGTSDEYAGYVDYDELGAIITKTVTIRPREGNPPPRIYETPAGMLNSIGLQNKGIDDFVEKKLPYFRKIKTHLIVNIAGESVEEFVELAKRLDSEKGVSALELNISCPNVKRGLEFCSGPEPAFEVVKAVRDVTRLPFFTKLSPEAGNFLGVARACVEAGTDGLSLINTIRGLAVDVKNKRPRLSTVFGGLSGPAIKPIALRYLYEVKRALKIPVIAGGGIMTAQDALEFIVTGAEMISVGTANFVNPRASTEIIQGLRDFLAREGLHSIDEIRGTLKVEKQRAPSVIPAG